MKTTFKTRISNLEAFMEKEFNASPPEVEEEPEAEVRSLSQLAEDQKSPDDNEEAKPEEEDKNSAEYMEMYV